MLRLNAPLQWSRVKVTKRAGFDALLTNGCGHDPDFLVCGTNHENVTLLSVRVWLRQGLGIGLLNRLCFVPGNLANRPDLFEFVEAPLRRSAQFLDGFAILHSRLSLNLDKGATFQPRFPLQYPQSVASFNALDLPGVTAEHDSGRLPLGQPEHLGHLVARDHTGFINDHHATPQFTMRLLILRQLLQAHGGREAHLLQFLNGTHGRGDGDHAPAGFSQTAMQFLERGRLPGTRGAAQANR